MENTHNQRIPSTEAKKVRQDDTEITGGARQTDQLQGLKENAEKDDKNTEHQAGSPPNTQVNDGEEKQHVET
jgi:hypothetical protein